MPHVYMHLCLLPEFRDTDPTYKIEEPDAPVHALRIPAEITMLGGAEGTKSFESTGTGFTESELIASVRKEMLAKLNAQGSTESWNVRLIKFGTTNPQGGSWRPGDGAAFCLQMRSGTGGWVDYSTPVVIDSKVRTMQVAIVATMV